MRAASCIVCGGEVIEGRMTCSKECYEFSQDTHAVGKRSELDGNKENRVRSILKGANTYAAGKYNRTCDYCGKPFRAKTHNQYCCSTIHNILSKSGYKNPYR